jgi:hypothetical protein
MTHDPATPDHATDPGPARRRKWGERLIWPALLLLGVELVVHLPKALMLATTFVIVALCLAVLVLLMPWRRSNPR